MFTQKMQGRFFAGRRVEASLYSGKERYRRTVGSGDGMEVDGDSEKKRLDDFANWLLTDGD
jgi:HIV Tat-specific factor 1